MPAFSIPNSWRSERDNMRGTAARGSPTVNFQANFLYDPVSSSGLEFRFTDITPSLFKNNVKRELIGDIVKQEWTFWHDGSKYEGNNNIRHTFPGFGNYTVTLKVTTSKNYTSSVTKTVTIPNDQQFVPIQPSFSDSPVPDLGDGNGPSIVLSDTTTGSLTETVTITTDTGETFTGPPGVTGQLFVDPEGPASEDIVVTVTATDDQGGDTSTTRTITVTRPTADVTLSQSQREYTTATDQSPPHSRPIASRELTFKVTSAAGGGITYATDTFTNTPDGPAILDVPTPNDTDAIQQYTFSLVLTDDLGFKATDVETIDIDPAGPTAIFTILPVPPGQEGVFRPRIENMSVTLPGAPPIVTSIWTFPDAGQDSLQPNVFRNPTVRDHITGPPALGDLVLGPDHFPGEHRVILTVIDADGNESTTEGRYTVPNWQHRPRCDFTWEVVGQSGDDIEVRFTCTSTDPDGDDTLTRSVWWLDGQVQDLYAVPQVTLPVTYEGNAGDPYGPRETFIHKYAGDVAGEKTFGQTVGWVKHLVFDEDGNKTAILKEVTIPRLEKPPVASLVVDLISETATTATYRYTQSASDPNGPDDITSCNTEVRARLSGSTDTFAVINTSTGGNARTFGSAAEVVRTVTFDKRSSTHDIRFLTVARDQAGASDTVTETLTLPALAPPPDPNPPVAQITLDFSDETDTTYTVEYNLRATDQDDDIASGTVVTTLPNGSEARQTGNADSRIELLTDDFSSNGYYTVTMTYDRPPPGSPDLVISALFTVTDQTTPVALTSTATASITIPAQITPNAPPTAFATVRILPNTLYTAEITGASTDTDGTVVNVDYEVVELGLSANGKTATETFTIDMPSTPTTETVYTLRVRATDDDGAISTGDVEIRVPGNPFPTLTDDAENPATPDDGGFHFLRQLPATLIQNNTTRPTASVPSPPDMDSGAKSARGERRKIEQNEFLVYQTNQTDAPAEGGALGTQFAIPFYWDATMPRRYMSASLVLAWVVNESMVLGGWEQGPASARVDAKADYNRKSEPLTSFYPGEPYVDFVSSITESVTVTASLFKETGNVTLGQFAIGSSDTDKKMIRHFDLSSSQGDLTEGINKIVIEFSNTATAQQIAIQSFTTAWGTGSGADFIRMAMKDIAAPSWATRPMKHIEISEIDDPANGIDYRYRFEQPYKLLCETPTQFEPQAMTCASDSGSGIAFEMFPETHIAHYAGADETTYRHHLPTLIPSRGDGQYQKTDANGNLNQPGGLNVLTNVVSLVQIENETLANNPEQTYTSGILASSDSNSFLSASGYLWACLLNAHAPQSSTPAAKDASSDAKFEPYYTIPPP